MPNQVTVRYGSKGAKQVTGEIRSVHDAFNRLQKQGAKGFGIGVGATVTAAAFNLVGQAIGGVTNLIGDSVEAYKEEERSVAKLNTSLKANVAGFDGQTGAIEKVIARREKLAFSDEDLRNSLALLVAATHDTNKALDIQTTAMDLARLKGISLADASTALIRVEGGQYRALKGLGIALKDGATQTEALAAVQKVAQGQAAAYADTLDGKLTAAQIRMNDKMEEFGKGFAELQANLATTVVDTLDWADAIRQADRLLPGFAHGTDAQRAALKALADSLLHATDEVENHGDALIGLRTPQKAVTDGIGQQSYALRILADAFQRTTGTVQDQIDALEDLDRAGKAQKAIDALEEWRKATGKLNAEQQKLYDLLVKNYQRAKLFAGITFAGGGLVFTGIPTSGKRASGGPVSAGKAYTVGEKGIETFVPAQNGTIVPHGAAGGSMVVNINVSTPALTPGSAQELARVLTPVIAREMQRGGLIAGARTF